MDTQDAIKRVVIVGGGTAGWMSAAVLARTLGRQLSITVVESDQIGTVGVGEATIPQIRLLNGLLGLDEHQFLAATQGSIKLGIEFDGWSQPGDKYLHAFGGFGQPLGMLRFYQYWLRAHHAGNAESLWDYSFNAVAASRNRYAHVDHIDGTHIEGLVRAYHFDASLFAKHLRALSERNGVTRVEGIVGEVKLEDDGRVARLELKDGAAVEGDFFIDCSGFRGLLIGDALGVGYEDWTEWLPCDRAVAVPCESVDPLIPYTRASARPAGWQWRIPLQHRIGNGHVFCSEFMSEDEATAVLLQNLDGAPTAEPRTLRFTTGRREKFWHKNCVSLGLAAGFMEPLESTSIHLVQSGLSRLISLFPNRGLRQAEIDSFNRQTDFEYERIRDFLILHYFANGRSEPFWAARRQMRVPDSLTERIDLFRANGRIVRDGDELFTEVGWLQVMLGQGIQPAGYDPLAGNLSEADLTRFLNSVREAIQRGTDPLPLHSEFIQSNCAAQPPIS
ncbi:MAG: tryptophan halogenase family protein [Pseudomonadota bacterium]